MKVQPQFVYGGYLTSHNAFRKVELRKRRRRAILRLFLVVLIAAACFTTYFAMDKRISMQASGATQTEISLADDLAAIRDSAQSEAAMDA